MFESKKKALAMSVLCTITSVGFVIGASAAENGDIQDYTLDEMVVTGTTTPNSINRANASVTVITRKDIENNHYTTMADALEHVTGVQSVLFADGAGFEVSGESSLTIRGTSDVVVVVDGVVQKTGSGYKTYLLNMNMDDIEKIEVLKGSASTLYGANAVGGVVNIITRRDYSGENGKIKIAWGDFGQQNYHFTHWGGDEKGFWALSYDKAKKGDYKDGYGKNMTRDVDSDAVDIKLGAHLSDETDFILKYQDMRYNSFATYKGYSKTGKRTLIDWMADYRAQTATGIVDYRGKDGREANNFSILYGKFVSERDRSNATSHPWEVTDRDNIQITNRYYRQLSDNNRIAAGIEWQKYNVGTVAAPDRYIREQAAYIQDEWDITDKLKLTGGLRYVHSDNYKSQWIDSVNLAYAFNDKINLYALSNEFYKTPSTTAIFGNSSFFANPDIQPETGRNNEIGLNMAFDKDTRLDIAAFDRRYENAIVVQDLPGDVNIYTNIDGVSHVKGGEVNFSKRFAKYFTAKLGYSRLVADADSQIPRLPKSQYTLGLSYERDNYDINIQGLHRADFAANNYFPAGFKALPEENYWVWNMSANYKVRDDIKLFARVNNIFDKGYMSATQYSTNGSLVGDPYSYYTAQGRNFIVGLEYSF